MITIYSFLQNKHLQNFFMGYFWVDMVSRSFINGCFNHLLLLSEILIEKRNLLTHHLNLLVSYLEKSKVL